MQMLIWQRRTRHLKRYREIAVNLARHGQLERGEVTFMYRLEGLQESLRQFQRAANRVSMSILAAALAIGLGLLMLIYHPPGWESYAGWFFGLIFVVVVMFNLGLLWKIWRSGR